jgi:hypothetical protein
VSLMRRWSRERRERQAQAMLLRRATKQSDEHTLTVAVRSLKQHGANPVLIEALNNMRERLVAALENNTGAPQNENEETIQGREQA